MKQLRMKRPARSITIGVASAAVGMAIALPGIALATNSGQEVPAPPANPTSASQIQNIDQVKTAIKAYYGDTATTIDAPGTGGTTGVPAVKIHTFDPNGAYAHEVEGIAANAAKTLGNQNRKTPKKAILFDIDDTTLNTYSYEIFSNFVYNPTTNANFVNAADPQVFPAVPGMVKLEQSAEKDGYTVFFLTGRPISQTDGTLKNLKAAGYDVTDSNVFLKDTTAQSEPWLQPCIVNGAFTCNTIQYKSLTRQYIEQTLGYDIVANFGDQFSDLKGGFADSTYKIPNPMYYLP